MTHLTDADRAAIHELIALHGHLVDDRRVDDLDQLFTEDAVYDGCSHTTAPTTPSPTS
jgi:hypothetical protein